jgi:hypothetical protein
MSPSTVIQAASGIIMAPPKVLMLVNAELGQANVFIATAHALLQENPGVDIHFASFPALQETLRDALGGAGDHGSTPFTFHPLPGRAMFKCFQEEEDLNNNIHTVSLQKPGVWNSPNSQKFIMTKAFLCWTAEEFASIYKSVDATKVQVFWQLDDPVQSANAPVTAARRRKILSCIFNDIWGTKDL